MNIKHELSILFDKLIVLVSRSVYGFFGHQKRDELLADLSNKLLPLPSIMVNGGVDRSVINFRPSSKKTVKRAYTMLTKEPDTICWIRDFRHGDVLWDIGANIGVFSLFAALNGVRVWGFEPFSANYAALVKNIEANDFSNLVSVLPIAISDGYDERIETFLIGDSQEGTSNVSQLKIGGEMSVSVSKSKTQIMRVMGICIPMDVLIKKYPVDFPSHLKIDVDGAELQVLKGGRKILADPRLKSVLLEVEMYNRDHCAEIRSELERACLHPEDGWEEFDSMVEKGIVRNFIFVKQTRNE